MLRVAVRKFWPPFLALAFALAGSADAADGPPRVAVITTVWRPNAHADVLATRLVAGMHLNGQGEFPKLKLVSAYVDQFPANDMSRDLAARHNFKIYETVAGALTLGGEKLAVDGVLLICEHGDYPRSETGSIQHPKRRLFAEIARVFEQSGRVVPVFSDKHLEDDWPDIAWMYGEAQRLKIPLMAGSSLPVAWRYPPADVARGRALAEIVAVGYGPLDAYGFHALEMVQCLAERRAGDETGVEHVQCLEGPAVWQEGRFDRDLLAAAASKFQTKPLPAGQSLAGAAKKPVLYSIKYRDGLRASVLMANDFAHEFSVAWRYADGQKEQEATLFWLQDERPYMHFAYLLKGIEQMMHSGRPTWPAERTLLTSGLLDAALTSRHRRHEAVSTPHLQIRYESGWNWQPPPLP